MRRIILNIEDGIPDQQAAECLIGVLRIGKISKTSRGEQYCFHTTTMSGLEITVTKQKSGTESFRIRKSRNQ